MDVSDVLQKVSRRFWFTLIIDDCIQVLGKPNRDRAASELDNVLKINIVFPNNNVFFVFVPSFWETGHTGHSQNADFWGYIANVPV